ncbi:MAG: NfeD family protein [Hyphomicrobiales bacterium]|nr:NfeD family protein [Hyphomicrobiales bacterium]
MALLGLPSLWGWLGVGLLLIAAEIFLVPGTYLLWIGLAALAMAAISAVWALPVALELALFGALALGCGVLGWRIYGARPQDDAARDLHNPEVTLVGRTTILIGGIGPGQSGQAKLDDVFWRVTGPELPAGARVRVLAVDGSTLVVEAA